VAISQPNQYAEIKKRQQTADCLPQLPAESRIRPVDRAVAGGHVGDAWGGLGEGMIAKLVRGQYSLAVAFWGFYVLGSLVLDIAMVVATAIFLGNHVNQSDIAALLENAQTGNQIDASNIFSKSQPVALVMTAIYWVYSILAWIGVWQSARKHPGGVWPKIAQVIVVIDAAYRIYDQVLPMIR
jgi:hypothetical protein